MGGGGKEGALTNGMHKHTKYKIFTPIKLEREYMNDHFERFGELLYITTSVYYNRFICINYYLI